MKSTNTMNECILSTLLVLLAYTLTYRYAGQPFYQEATNLNTLDSDQSFHYSPFIMPTCSRELEKRRKEEEVMAAATCRRRKKQWKGYSKRKNQK
jgi:hypothetical protein